VKASTNVLFTIALLHGYHFIIIFFTGLFSSPFFHATNPFVLIALLFDGQKSFFFFLFGGPFKLLVSSDLSKKRLEREGVDGQKV